MCGHVCGHVCGLLCANCDTLCDCFFCSALKQAKVAPPPPDESRPEPVLQLVVVEQFADPDEGAEDFFGGAEDEFDDLPQVVKSPEVDPPVKQ